MQPMEINMFPPLEPRTQIDPLVCIKAATLRAPWKTVEFLGFLEAHLCQTTVELVGTLAAAAESYG